jgi:hypothetical protein
VSGWTENAFWVLVGWLLSYTGAIVRWLARVVLLMPRPHLGQPYDGNAGGPGRMRWWYVPLSLRRWVLPFEQDSYACRATIRVVRSDQTAVFDDARLMFWGIPDPQHEIVIRPDEQRVLPIAIRSLDDNSVSVDPKWPAWSVSAGQAKVTTGSILLGFQAREEVLAPGTYYLTIRVLHVEEVLDWHVYKLTVPEDPTADSAFVLERTPQRAGLRRR